MVRQRQSQEVIGNQRRWWVTPMGVRMGDEDVEVCLPSRLWVIPTRLETLLAATTGARPGR